MSDKIIKLKEEVFKSISPCKLDFGADAFWINTIEQFDAMMFDQEANYPGSIKFIKEAE